MSTRLSVITNHLNTRFPPLPHDPSIETWRQKSASINPKVLFEGFYGKRHSYISQIQSFISSSPLFNYFTDLHLTREQLREKVILQLASVAKAFPMSYDIERANPTQKVDYLQALTEYDLSVSTRTIVHLSLYLDSITNFGTEKHRKFIDRAYTLEDIGCFGMTELGHGSNVAAVEVTATYIKETNEFLLNSPTATSAKWWIGAAAKTANMSVVFAQLIVEGTNQGVHMFLVPIRGPENSEIPGVSLGDCGPKMSLEGVDNGYIIFKNYKVPYDSLLDKISQINAAGKFKSSIKNKEKRLGIMIGALTRGRLAVILGSCISLVNSLTTSIRYSSVRKQFAPDNKTEVSILSYQNQKSRLVPILANAFAIRSAYLFLTDTYDRNWQTYSEHPEGEELAEFHALLSGFKAVCSWYSILGVQVCRESCGGHGYSSFSGLGRIRDNQEVHLTWEGDNSVLIQQTSKYITKQIQKTMKGHPIFSQSLKFLKLSLDEGKKGPINDLSSFYVAMEHVVNVFLHDSMMKLQEKAANGVGMNDVWNSCQFGYLQSLAKSYIELQAMKCFEKMARDIEEKDRKTGEVVWKLQRLYCLSVLERYLVVLVEIGYDAGLRKWIVNEIISLCEEIGEVSVGVVDAIGPNSKTLSSTLGMDDGQVYKKIIELVESNPETYKNPYWLPELLKIRGLSK